jgi:hypothetical protein
VQPEPDGKICPWSQGIEIDAPLVGSGALWALKRRRWVCGVWCREQQDTQAGPSGASHASPPAPSSKSSRRQRKRPKHGGLAAAAGAGSGQVRELGYTGHVISP